MSLTEATIQVHRGSNLLYIDVKYGAGKSKVPSDCLAIHQVVKPYFEQGAVAYIRQTLSQKMPDVEIRVIHLIDFSIGYSSEASDFEAHSDIAESSGAMEDSNIGSIDPPKLVRN